MSRNVPIAASLGFVGAILAANYVTGAYGLIPVGFGLATTAGTFFAGLTFVLRDTIHDTAGAKVIIGLIVLGAALSFFLSPAPIAIASGVAFLVSEIADLTVYAPLRKRGYIRAALASNVVGSFIDTVLFLVIAGFPIWSSVPGQMLAKFAVTAVVVCAVLAFRRQRWKVTA